MSFENEFYLLLHTPSKEWEISFLLPNHASQQPLFQQAFTGQGVYLTIEVDEVDKVYKELRNKGVPIKIDIAKNSGVKDILQSKIQMELELTL